MENVDMKSRRKAISNKLGKAGKWTVILGLIILLGSLVASLIQNDFGHVEISAHTLDTRDNQVVAYDLYLPGGVDTENKAPLIVVVAGFQRSRETQGHVALEFARRGFVVINIDPYGQGDSSSSSAVQGNAIATVEGYGAFDLIDYVYDNEDVYPYVDKDRIGVTGHSAGGNAAYQAAVHFGKKAVDNDGVSKVHSIFISGYVLSITSDIVFSKSNMGMDYALYDEGAFRNKVNDQAPEGTSKGDMRWAIESHDFVNSGLAKAGIDPIPNREPIVIEKIYGNPNLRNMRQVFNTETIHAFQPYSVEATGKILRYFEVAMDYRNEDLSPTDQVWMYKEILTTITLVSSLAMIVPIGALLYRIPFFKDTKKEPIIVRKKRSVFGLVVYIVTFVVSATFAALTYLPSSRLTFVFFPKASNSVNSWFFPQRMTNAVAIWAVISGTFALLMFILAHVIVTKYAKNDAKKEDLLTRSGLRITFKNFMKTALLAFLVVFAYFGFLMIVYGLFHVDYRFIFVMAARRVNMKSVIQLLMYFPVFFVFYFSNSIRVNGGQMHGKLSERTKLVLAGFMNIAGLAVILFLQYYAFVKTGTIAFTELSDGTTQWLYVNILFTLIPVIFLMPFFNRWFYRMSGNAYVGPMIICAIFILMAISNSVAYIPN